MSAGAFKNIFLSLNFTMKNQPSTPIQLHQFAKHGVMHSGKGSNLH